MNLLRSVRSSLLDAWYRVVMAYPLWFYIRNAAGRHQFEKRVPALSDVSLRVVADLKQSGIARTSLAELFPERSGLLEELAAYAESLRDAAEQRSTKKPFILEYWDAEPTLDLGNPFVSLSLEPVVLAIVNSYMRMWSKFYYFMLGRTTPSEAGKAAQASQRWHRDYEEIRMCKMFIYLSDVTESSGPFIYIPGSHLGGKYRAVFPQKPGRGCYPPEGGVEEAIPSSEYLVATGVAGTVLFADTTGLHRGGLGREGGRIMYTAGYNSSAALGRKRYRLPRDSSSLALLSPEACFALRGLTPRSERPV